jgi:septal ring factor EnvC (AmiA/AmiB activator)
MSALTDAATDVQLDEANQELTANGATGLEVVRTSDLEASNTAAQSLEARIESQNDAIARLTAQVHQANTEARAAESGLAETTRQLEAANTRLAGYVESTVNTGDKQDEGNGKTAPQLTMTDFKALAQDHPFLFPSLTK